MSSYSWLPVAPSTAFSGLTDNDVEWTHHLSNTRIYKLNGKYLKTTPQWGTTLTRQWDLWAMRILQISIRESKGEVFTKRVPQFGPQNQAYGGANSGTPSKACSQGILMVPLLASILRSWHRCSWN